MHPLSASEARARTTSGVARLVDIREAYEAATARVEGAMSIPLGLLLADPQRLRSSQPVLVLDHEGTRAPFAARFLREHGVEAHPVAGGALAYLAAQRS